MENLFVTGNKEGIDKLTSKSLELEVSYKIGPRGLDYSYSDAEIMYDAIQAHRDRLIKSLDEIFNQYATQQNFTQAEFQASLSSGDFVIILDQIKVLNNQMDTISSHALAFLRQQE